VIAFLLLWLQYIGLGILIALGLALALAIPVAVSIGIFVVLCDGLGVDEDTAGGICVLLIVIVIIAGLAAAFNMPSQQDRKPAEATEVKR
jgi:uncharacterized membrane protein YhhN